MEQAQFIVIGVADGGDAVAVRQAAAVELAVEAKALGGVGDLHRAGDAAVLKRANADKVGATMSDEVHVLFETKDMLGLQKRRLEQLAELLVGKNRDAAILIGIFKPEVARLVAGATHAQGVGPRLVFAGRVNHQVHPVAHALANCEDIGHLASDGSVAPAVNLERGIADRRALLGEVGKGFRSAQAAVLVAVISRSIGGDGLSSSRPKAAR